MSEKDQLNDMYRMVYEMHGDLKAFKADQLAHKSYIVEHAQDLEKLSSRTAALEKDRNRIYGAASLGGFAGFVALLKSILPWN